MKIQKLLTLCTLLSVLLTMTACGGGGGGSSAPAGKTINGVAQAGIFSKGKAVFKGYSGVNQSKEYTLTFCTFSGSQGAFSANVGGYSGPLRINISGNFNDEATGRSVTITDALPLKALVPGTSVTSGTTIPVTPLTDIAATKTLQTTMTNASITRNNQGVAQLFGLTDVTTAIPVAVTSLTSQTTSGAATTYAVALVQLSAYVAQFAATTTGMATTSVTGRDLQDALSSALNQISSGITIASGTGTGAPPVVTVTAPEVVTTLSAVVNSASATLPAATVNAIKSAVNTSSDATRQSMKSYNLTVTSSSATPLYGVQMTVTIPDGMQLSTNARGVTSTGAVTSLLPGGIVTGRLTGNNMLTLWFGGGSHFTANSQAGLSLGNILCSVSGDAAGSLSVTDVSGLDGDNPVAGVVVVTALLGN